MQMFQSDLQAVQTNVRHITNVSKPAPFKAPPTPTLYRLRFRLRRLSRHFRHASIRHIVLLITALISFFLLPWPGLLTARYRPHHAPSFHIGISHVDITPTEPVWLAGFASRNHSPSHAQLLHPYVPLTARALAIFSQNVTVVIVSLDIIAIPKNLSSQIYKAAAQRYRLNTATLRLCVTHTHSGPVIADSLAPLSPTNADDLARIDRYERVLFNSVIDAISKALAERTPVDVRFAHAHAALAVNRRLVTETEFHQNGVRRGPTDHTVPVVTFRHATDGHVVAGVFGYAAHATIMTSGYRYSGDYPSLTIAQLQRQYPGSTWMFLAGCGGDQNIYPRGNITWLLRHAHALAIAIQHVVDKAMSRQPEAEHSPGTLDVRYKRINLPFAKRYSKRELRRKASLGQAQRRAVRTLMRGIESDGMTQASYSYPIAIWRIESKVIAFLGGEPTVGYSQLLKDVGVDWVVGYSEDVMGYVGTKDVIQSGGREGGERAAWYYGLPSAWNARVQDLIVQTVAQLVNEGSHLADRPALHANSSP